MEEKCDLTLPTVGLLALALLLITFPNSNPMAGLVGFISTGFGLWLLCCFRYSYLILILSAVILIRGLYLLVN